MQKSKIPFIVEMMSARRKAYRAQRNEIWKEIDIEKIRQAMHSKNRTNDSPLPERRSGVCK